MSRTESVPTRPTRTKSAYRVGEVATMLGVSVESVRGWCRSGKLACTRTPGGHHRIAVAAVDALVAAMTPPPAPRADLAA